MILLCYDGSGDAGMAIRHAAALMPTQQAVVLTVWEGLGEVVARARTGRGSTALEIADIDATGKQAAERCAQEGVALAREAGMAAEPKVQKRAGAVWETILSVGDELDAGAIVLGSRGLTGLRSLLLGSVSHAVLQHAQRPVVVVPSRRVAEKRKSRRH